MCSWQGVPFNHIDFGSQPYLVRLGGHVSATATVFGGPRRRRLDLSRAATRRRLDRTDHGRRQCLPRVPDHILPVRDQRQRRCRRRIGRPPRTCPGLRRRWCTGRALRALDQYWQSVEPRLLPAGLSSRGEAGASWKRTLGANRTGVRSPRREDGYRERANGLGLGRPRLVRFLRFRAAPAPMSAPLYWRAGARRSPRTA